MKIKFFAAAMLISVSLSSMAQGYKDGIEYYKVDQLDNAKELLERNLSAASTNKAEAYYYLGQIALQQKNTAEAKANFDKGVAADASFPYNYVGQGQLVLASDAKAAAALFDSARKLSKKDSKLETAIARAYYDVNPTTFTKEIEKCIKNARKWNAQDPESFIFEGDTFADKKDWGSAAGQYELAYTYDPSNIEAQVKWANTYYNVNPDMALQHLEQLNANYPNSALVQRQLAEKYYDSNQGGKAAEKYGEYIKNPNHFAQDEVRYVQLLFFGEKFQESYDLATSLINKLSANDPNVFYMQRMKLYNKVALKQWNDAVVEGDKFFAIAKPAKATYEVKDYIDFAQALQEAGHAEKAIAAYEKAVELNPNNLDLLRSLSDTYADAKNYAKSAEYYKKVVENDQCKANDFYVASRRFYNLALTTEDEAVKAHAMASARKYIEIVNERVPDNIPIVNQMARIEKLEEGGKNTGKAVATYKKLIKLLDAKENSSDYDSDYCTAYQYLANHAWDNDDKATAKEYYKLWLQHDPENADLRKYVESLK